MKKAYPMDAYGIEKLGVENWIDNYHVAVTGSEYEQILDNIISDYILLIKKNTTWGSDLYWLFLSNIKLAISFLPTHIKDLILFSRLKDADYTHIIGKNQHRLLDSISVREASKFNPNASICEGSAYRIRAKSVVKGGVKSLLWSINGAISFGKNIFSKDTHKYFRAHREIAEVEHFCCNEKISTFMIDPYLLNLGKKKISDLGYDKVRIDEFVAAFMSLVGERYPIILESNLDDMAADIKSYFYLCLQYYRNAQRYLRKIKHKTLLLHGMGSPMMRLFCAAWRSTGSDILLFPHGHRYANGYWPGPVLADGMLIANKFIAPSKGYAKIYNKNVEDFSYGLKSSEICRQEKSIYHAMYSGFQKDPDVKKIRKIMVMGFPMGSFYHPWVPEHHFYAHIDLEFRLLKQLAGMNYHIIYKAHPDRLDEASGLFREYCDEFREEYFETLYKEADCVIFPYYIDATAFGYTMLTKIPMVALKVREATYCQEANDLIEKRCSIVDLEVDEDCRLQYDEGELAEAIKKSINCIDHQVIQEFAL